MGINRFFKFFLPKESKFLPLLRGQVDDIVKASELLIEFSNAGEHARRKELYAGIKRTETHCDGLTDAILDALNNTFITPFDREDIHTLASQLDDVLDLINGSAKRVVLYQPREMPGALVRLAELIRESALCLQSAVYELDKVNRNPAVIKQQCRKLHELENAADDVYEDFIISLFGGNGDRDAIELMKQVEIIQLYESATDKAYRVSEVLRTIMVKYA